MEQFFSHGDDPFKPEKGPNGVMSRSLLNGEKAAALG
jgi:hypothetical protein